MRGTHKINELHTIALKETAEDAAELIELTQDSDSDQLLLDKDAPKLCEYDQGD